MQLLFFSPKEVGINHDYFKNDLREEDLGLLFRDSEFIYKKRFKKKFKSEGQVSEKMSDLREQESADLKRNSSFTTNVLTNLVSKCILIKNLLHKRYNINS